MYIQVVKVIMGIRSSNNELITLTAVENPGKLGAHGIVYIDPLTILPSLPTTNLPITTVIEPKYIPSTSTCQNEVYWQDQKSPPSIKK
jgi:hypothetical protein